MTASPAVVAAAQEALRCAKVEVRGEGAHCWSHGPQIWTDLGCPVAVEVASKVAAAALREWINEWPTTPGDGTFLANVARDGRARADEQEATP